MKVYAVSFFLLCSLGQTPVFQKELKATFNSDIISVIKQIHIYLEVLV